MVDSIRLKNNVKKKREVRGKLVYPIPFSYNLHLRELTLKTNIRHLRRDHIHGDFGVLLNATLKRKATVFVQYNHLFVFADR
jgi:hypothetical protein